MTRLDRLLADMATSRPDADAFHWVDRDRRLTYGEVDAATDRAAAALSALGVGPGGRVGVFAHPGLDYVVALFATWRLDATAILVDLAAKDELAKVLGPEEPDLLVYTNDHFDYVQAALGRLPSVTAAVGMDGPQEGTVGWEDALAAADPGDRSEPGDDPDRIAHVSLPKSDESPVATHAEIEHTARDVASRLELADTDRTICPTALSRRFHLEASILPAVLAGCSAGMFKSWSADSGWDAMEEHATTVLCAEATHCRDVLAVSEARGRAPASLRVAAMPPSSGSDELVRRFREQLDIELVVTGPASVGGD